MAASTSSTLRALIVSSLLLSISLAFQTVAGRNIATDSSKLHPESFDHFDGSVLIPGIGRVMIPTKRMFHYNPITGVPDGGGAGVPGPVLGGSTGGGPGGGQYIPGGDDTFLPNPGVEVPNPAGGGNSGPTGP